MNMKRRRMRWMVASALLIVSLGAGVSYYFFGPLLLEKGFRYAIVAGDLPSVSALAFTPDGELYATLERTRGQGSLVRIHDGGYRTLVDGLNKPDGLLMIGDTLYITSETGPDAVLAYRNGKLADIQGADSAEGIAEDHGRLLVIEDKKGDGRLLRIDPSQHKVDVLARNLTEAEGVCQGPDGDIYFVEKNEHALWRLAGGQRTQVVAGLIHPAYLNCIDDGSVLITEDRTNFGRLLRYRDGRVDVIARNLRSPQTVLLGDDGAYYLAEQRRNRILKIDDF